MFKPVMKGDALGLETTLDYGRFKSLSEALNDLDYSAPNMYAIIHERGNGVFQTVLTSGVTPNGYTIIQSTAVPTISFVLMAEGAINVRHVGITGVGDTDDSPAFNFLVSTGLPVVGNAGDKYFIQSKIVAQDVDFDFDMRGGKFIEDSALGQTFQIKNTLQNQVSVTTLGSTTVNLTPLTTLTLSNSTAYNVGDVVKIACDDRIRPTATTTKNEYLAEYAVVTAKVASTVTLDVTLKLLNASSTNIRVARLAPRKFRFVNAKFGMTYERATYTSPYHISCEGYISPQFNNLEVEAAAGIFIKTLSCYGAIGRNISGDKLLNDPANGKYGIGVVDSGSQASNWYELSFGRCMSAYSTGSELVDINASPALSLYGGAVRCQVWSGNCTGATSFAWSTNNDAFECVFHQITASAGRKIADSLAYGGFQDRGVNTVVHKLTYQGNALVAAEPDSPFFFGEDSDSAKIHECHVSGNSLQMGNYATAKPTSFFIGLLDVSTGAFFDELLSFDTTGTVKIQKLNLHIKGDIASGGSAYSLIALEDTGAFYLDECNVFADDGNTQTVNSTGNYNFIRINAANHKGVFATFNVYCGAATAESLGNAKFIDAGSNVVSMGKLSVNIYSEEIPVARTAEIINNLGAGSNVPFDVKIHSRLAGTANLYDSAVGTISLISATSLLYFGPNGYPWNRTENRYTHRRLVKHLTSNNDTNQITEIVKPAFDGQEFVLHVPASSNSFVLIGDCPGMHTDWSASNVTFTAGASYTFVSRWDSANNEYLWDYLG